MANKSINGIIQFRRDTTANWNANKTVIPASGEPCFDLNKQTLKIGDGVSTYEQLTPISGVVNISADNKSVVLTDNTFKMYGFDAAATGAQPRKNSEGKIEWVVPSTDTVEGLQTSVASMQSDITTLQNLIGTQDDSDDTVISRLGSLESQIDIYNGNEDVDGSIAKRVASKVTSEINEFATNISNDNVVNTFKELVDYVADHSTETADMAADILALQGLVGDVSVSTQITNAINNVNVPIETVSLGGTALEISNKNVNIPTGAGLKASDEVTIGDDGTLGVGEVDFDKITQKAGSRVVFDGGDATNN